MLVLERTRVNGVEYWKLNRPHVKNAVNTELMEEMQKALNDVERNAPNQLVIYGAGHTFCSGGDVKAFRSLYTRSEALGMLLPMNRILQRIRSLSFPVTAYIEGTAAGGGAELAVCCDFLAAQQDAKIGFIQGRIGLTPGWGGGTCLFSRVVEDTAKEALEQAELYSVKVWKQAGLIDAIASSPEEAARSIERLLQQGERPSLPLASGNVLAQMEEEAYRCAEKWASSEHHEAVTSFVEKKR